MRIMSAVFLSFFVSALALFAAEITLVDGQVIDGEIVDELSDQLVIQVVSGSGTAVLPLPRTSIKSIDGQSPDGEEALAAKPAFAGAASVNRAGVYETIDLTGAIGSDIFSSAIESALIRARRLSIKDIVFIIDSAVPGDLDEAINIGGVLAKYRDSLQFHCLVKRARGPAMVFLLHAHTLHVASGVTVGSIQVEAADLSETARTMRTGLANQAAQSARAYGRNPAIWRALIDPSVSLSIWKDGSGVVQAGSVPADLDANAVIATVSDQQTLVLTESHFAAAGFTVIASAEDIGPSLHRSTWTAGSGALQKNYASAVADQQARLQKQTKRTQRKLEKVVSQRDNAYQVLRQGVATAKRNDPTKGDYATIEGVTNNDRWRGGRFRGGRYVFDEDDDRVYDTHVYTDDSRKEWERRSKITFDALVEARTAALSLVKLEEEAAELGLEVITPVNELEAVVDRLEEEANRVYAQRNKRGN